jgi:Ca2+-binding RTX toxin-like protein
MRKTFLVVPAVLAATLIPSISSSADIHMCHGEVANVVGTPGDDILYGTAELDVIAGLGGDDTIYGEKYASICGHGGSDKLYSKGGHSSLYGGRGDDQLYGEDFTEDGFSGGPGDDVITGRGVASYIDARRPIKANLSSGIVTGQGTDTLVGIDHVDGTAFGDTLIGNESRNVFRGFRGNDVIKARGGIDALHGGDGDDRLFGQAGGDGLGGSTGDDLINGASGTDEVYFMKRIWASLVTGRAEGEGKDTLVNIDQLFGSPFDDTLIGDRGPNYLNGSLGNDLIYGRRGGDVLEDWRGTHDRLYGNLGNDRLLSDDGPASGQEEPTDLLDGGWQEDECVFGHSDTIVNCEL